MKIDRKEIREGRMGFTIYTESYYARPDGLRKNTTEEIYFGSYPEGILAGTFGEACFRFIKLGNDKVSTPCLEAFFDSWQVMAEIPGLFDALAGLQEEKEKSITPQDICEMLRGLGLEDLTLRENPNKEQKPPPLPTCSQWRCEQPVADPSLTVCFDHVDKDALLLRIRTLRYQLEEKEEG